MTETARALANSGLPDPRREARILLGIVIDAAPLALLTETERQLSPEQQAQLAEALKRRLNGEPLSRIRGRREFWSLDFKISPDVLDPRPETELLVEQALEWVAKGPGRHARKPLRILDLGTGSGCILLSLLHELPEAFGIGLDLNLRALRIARANAVRHDLSKRAAWVCGQWLQSIDNPFDLVVANPPYIAAGAIATLGRGVRSYDPGLALDGGPDGLAPYRAIIPGLARVLRPDGAAFLEVGAGQADWVAALGEKAGMICRIRDDLAGIPRCVRLSGKISACNDDDER
ncbi:MAG TPA: peptide chain release factor N(5)-glutamine methyltransferase [Alphaproteobacteria bacterium]|nr:peptide chain release factor N(5)-glutamine methyltransferase [Alphaproteobacteria bacterium]